MRHVSRSCTSYWSLRQGRSVGGAHAPLAPSFAPVWGCCSAAVLAAASAPNIETDASREGTAAHWVFAEVLLNIRDGRAGALFCVGYVGQTAPNGVVIDEKMAEGAQVMVDDVMSVVERHRTMGAEVRSELQVEHRVAMPGVHPTNNWGTLDAAIVLWKGGQVVCIFLWDYKHGHRENRAAGNLQLIDYAEGLREELNLNGSRDQRVTLVLRIVQPFCYRSGDPVDEWVGRLSDIRGLVNGLRDKGREAFTNPLMTPGLHCRDCPGKYPCSARRRADYNVIDLANEPYEMDIMSVGQLATERQILDDGLKAAAKRLEAIDDTLKARISAGESGSGLALEATYGRLAWTVPPEQANALASQFGFDISTVAVQTPTQAKQAAPKAVRGMFEQVLRTVATRPPSGLKLIKAEDSKVARAFSKRS